MLSFSKKDKQNLTSVLSFFLEEETQKTEKRKMASVLSFYVRINTKTEERKSTSV